MIPVTPQTPGFGYGGGSQFGSNSAGGLNGELLQMLHQLVQHRLGVTNIGVNKYKLDPNGLNIGVLDSMGNYRPGF
jgi:hypothetical protein